MLTDKEKLVLIDINDTLLDQGGPNKGCVVEPDTFKQRIAGMDEQDLRKILVVLEGYLDKTRRLFNESN